MRRSSLEFLDRFMDQLTQNRLLCGHVGGPNTDGDLSGYIRISQRAQILYISIFYGLN